MSERAERAERREAEALTHLEDARREAETARRAAEDLLQDLDVARQEADTARAAAAGGAAPIFGGGGEALPSYRRGEEIQAVVGAPQEIVDEPGAPSREGFQDAPQPIARIKLDGHFMQLNDRFCELVGYSESEFRRAMWPSVSDRENLERHRRLMRRMREGELESAEVDTAYLHEQGLLVGMKGLFELQRDEAGEPAFFEFRIETPAEAGA
jgi:PAS domain S-box-containing protein